MKHVMFDIDGTLIESYDLDSALFSESVYDVTGISIDSNWERYRNVTDSGIIEQFVEENGITQKIETEEKIKRVFFAKLKRHMAIDPIREVSGAKEFLAKLKSMNNVTISIATGGWYESAVLKLSSAGIEIKSIPLASSNDHVSRTEIMKIAAQRATEGSAFACTYFGDGAWDRKACELLGFNFVLVGNKITHNQRVTTFKPQNQALAYIGL